MGPAPQKKDHTDRKCARRASFTPRGVSGEQTESSFGDIQKHSAYLLVCGVCPGVAPKKYCTHKSAPKYEREQQTYRGNQYSAQDNREQTTLRAVRLSLLMTGDRTTLVVYLGAVFPTLLAS